MAHRKNQVSHTWTPELAYAVGVIASDGNLSPDKRHICVTSKDLGMIETMRALLNLKSKIGQKARGGSREKKYFVLQFSDKSFYEFLLSIGLTPAKSKTISKLTVPDEYFADFLRGCIDGDGSIGSFTHPESKHPQVRVRLCSASLAFLTWILERTKAVTDVQGGFFYSQKDGSIHILSFAVSDSRKVLRFMYYDGKVPALERKRTAAMEILKGRVA